MVETSNGRIFQTGTRGSVKQPQFSKIAIQHTSDPVPSPGKEEGWRQEGQSAVKEVLQNLQA